MHMIEQAELIEKRDDTSRKSTEIVKYCKTCQLKQLRPKRFLFPIRAFIVGYFNHVLQIDIAKLIHGYVLHVIHLKIDFRNGSFVVRIDVQSIFKFFRRIWINIYTGSLHYVQTDADTDFNSADFKHQARFLRKFFQFSPIETRNRIGSIKKIHGYF